jgi:hypothetical protein
MYRKAMLCACALIATSVLFAASSAKATHISVTGVWNTLAPAFSFASYPGPPDATFEDAYLGWGDSETALNGIFRAMAVIIEPIAGDDTFAVIIEPIAGDDTFNATLEWLDTLF